MAVSLMATVTARQNRDDLCRFAPGHLALLRNLERGLPGLRSTPNPNGQRPTPNLPCLAPGPQGRSTREAPRERACVCVCVRACVAKGPPRPQCRSLPRPERQTARPGTGCQPRPRNGAPSSWSWPAQAHKITVLVCGRLLGEAPCQGLRQLTVCMSISFGVQIVLNVCLLDKSQSLTAQSGPAASNSSRAHISCPL